MYVQKCWFLEVEGCVGLLWKKKIPGTRVILYPGSWKLKGKLKSESWKLKVESWKWQSGKQGVVGDDQWQNDCTRAPGWTSTLLLTPRIYIIFVCFVQFVKLLPGYELIVTCITFGTGYLGNLEWMDIYFYRFFLQFVFESAVKSCWVGLFCAWNICKQPDH